MITLNGKEYNWAQFDQSGASRYLETSSEFPNGASPLTAKVSSTGKARKVKWRLAIPTVAAGSTSCSCPGEVQSTDYLVIEADLSAVGTLASRADMLARIKSLVLTTAFGDSITKLVQPSA